MIFYWIREIAGWLLVGAALLLVRIALLYIDDRQVVEAGVVAMISLALLRSGVLLVRISVAARIASRE